MTARIEQGGSGDRKERDAAADGEGEGGAKGKGKKGSKGGKKGKSSGSQGSPGNASTASAKGATVQAKQGEGEGSEKPRTQEGASGTGNGGEGKTNPETQAGEPIGQTAQMMAEVTNLLKSLRVDAASQHGVRAMALCSLHHGKADSVLIDGGATHVLRRVKDAQEWESSCPVTVNLATGSVDLRQNPWSGSLLTQDACQMILPMSLVTKLGYEVVWKQEECVITSSDGSKLSVNMDQGCPTVDVRTGHRLLQEIEEFQSRAARLKVLALTKRLGLSTGSDIATTSICQQDVTKVAKFQELFPQVPQDIAVQVPGISDWDVNQLPFNRRLRRKIQLASSVVLHLFSGPDRKFWIEHERNGLVVLCAELQHGVDLRNGHTIGWIESLIGTGKVQAILAGPPCRTISVCRARDDGGPRVVRTRTGPQRFGRDDLSLAETSLVKNDNLLWMRTLWLMVLAHRANASFEGTLEQPQDPLQWKEIPHEDHERYPSYLLWPETRRVMEILGLKAVNFNQGALGHKSAKPTTALSNSPEVLALDGLQSAGFNASWPHSLQARLTLSRSLSEWAPGFKQCLGQVIHRLSMSPKPTLKWSIVMTWNNGDCTFTTIIHHFVETVEIALLQWVGINNTGLSQLPNRIVSVWTPLVHSKPVLIRSCILQSMFCWPPTPSR